MGEILSTMDACLAALHKLYDFALLNTSIVPALRAGIIHNDKQ